MGVRFVALPVACLLLAGCGTRVDQAEILAGAGAGSVTIPLDPRPAVPAAVRIPVASPAVAAQAPARSVPPPTAATRTKAVPAPAGRPAAVQGPAAVKAPRPTTAGPVEVARAPQTAAIACTGTEAPVVLGQVGSFSGIAGELVASARDTLALWVKDVNARGGLACHRVVLYSQDDGSDTSRSAAIVQDMVENKKAVALIGAFAPISFAGLLTGVERFRIPVVGGDLTAFEWNTNPYLFPQGSGILALMDGLVRNTVDSGHHKIGMLYCVEASMCARAAKRMPESVQNAGAELVYTTPISLTQPDFTAQCQNAKAAGVEGLIITADGSAIGRLARSCATLGYHPQFITAALSITPGQAAESGLRQNTVASASANAPWMLEDTPGLTAYHQALRAYAPDLEPDSMSISAWAAGKLLEAAIAGLGPSARTEPLTTAAIFRGLGRVKGETLGGLAPPLTFSPNQKFAPEVPCVYYLLLDSHGWVAPRGSRPVCR